MSELVISVDQPYASLIVAGTKRFETRPSPPNGNMRPKGVRGLPGSAINRGDRLLVASTARDTDNDRSIPIAAWDALSDIIGGDAPLRGYILGSVTVTDVAPIVAPSVCGTPMPCVEAEAESLTLWYPPSGAPGDEADEQWITDQLPFGDWQPGRWAWELADPRPFDAPIPVVGRQGVWRWNGAA